MVIREASLIIPVYLFISLGYHPLPLPLASCSPSPLTERRKGGRERNGGREGREAKRKEGKSKNVMKRREGKGQGQVRQQGGRGVKRQRIKERNGWVKIRAVEEEPRDGKGRG